MTNERKDQKQMTQEELKRLREGDTATSYEDAIAFKRLVNKMKSEKSPQE